jgi:hypothetical protein
MIATSDKISLFNVQKFHKALVINRPSKKIKSPYLADIKLFDENDNLMDEELMAHSPALGCCGLIAKDAIVYVTENNDENSKRKSKYTIYNVQISDPSIIIGVHPMSANTIFENILKNSVMKEFENAKNIKREYKILNSRIDFYFEIGEKKIFLEIKNVPLADHVDLDKKNKEKICYDPTKYNSYEKIAIFPDGYRKKSSDLISPRAYKHLEDLIEIQKNDKHQTYLIYIVQRLDVKYFSPSILDKTYYDKVYEAIDNGVKIIPLSVVWEGENVYFNKILEFLPKK